MQLIVGTLMLYISLNVQKLMNDVSLYYTRPSDTSFIMPVQPSNNVTELTVVFTSLVLFSATQGMQFLSLFILGSDRTIDIAVDG